MYKLQTLSASIKAFLDLISEAQTEYEFCLESMKNEDKKTQDYLHQLELSGLNYHERSKIATQLALNRKERRRYKDSVEELEPFVEFFDNSRNQAFQNQLTQLLGQIRKVEAHHKNRFYSPKILPIEPIKDDITTA